MKPAWPAANETARGAYAASIAASGSAIHNHVSLLPMARSSRPPTVIPASVPSSAWTIVAPVLSALERSTESDPSTTQNACWTDASEAMKTAIASPIAPRALLRNQTDRTPACAAATRSEAASATPWRRRKRSQRGPSPSGAPPPAMTAWAAMSSVR